MSKVFDQPISEVMTRDVVTLEASATIHDALNVMSENRVAAVPVVDHQQHCVGILSTSDLVDLTRDVDADVHDLDFIDPATQRFLLDKLVHTLGNEPVQSYMSDAVTSVSTSSSVGEATRKMVREGIHHLPVVDENEVLVGFLSTMDLLAVYADAAE